MKNVVDDSGRFTERPHYAPHELDRIFESVVTSFLKEMNGTVCFPLSTLDLTSLLNRDAGKLEHLADISRLGGFEGATKFFPGSKPQVTIAEKLARGEKYVNRLRTALAHEYGHVYLHANLYEIREVAETSANAKRLSYVVRCKRRTMMSATSSNWMEWQANYACRALLMPASYVKRVVADYMEKNGLDRRVTTHSAHDEEVIDVVVEKFQVSRAAARARLVALNILACPDGITIPYLFP